MDANDDGTVDISDPVYVLNFLFLGGAPPKSPYPHCGRDDTDDKESCILFNTCSDL